MKHRSRIFYAENEEVLLYYLSLSLSMIYLPPKGAPSQEIFGDYYW